MDKDLVIKIRDFYKSIKVTTSDGKENSINITIKIDNDGWISEGSQEVFWDDANGICYYFHSNQIRFTTPTMIGSDHITVPAVISAFDYGEIQEIRAQLNATALKLVLNKLSSWGAKVKRNGTDEDISDDIKKSIYKHYVLDTNPATDYNYHVANNLPFK